uniref:Uncharacterized protein n=1 Tax=Brassica oleracea TaxID=3712 RepID=A0A3P6FGA5_BRAOL|nr:unnamed protein product [Brassica oleracea]
MCSKQLYIPYGVRGMQGAMEINLLQQTDLFIYWIRTFETDSLQFREWEMTSMK